MSNPSGTIGTELVLVSAPCPQGKKSGPDIKLHILYPGHLKYFPNPVYRDLHPIILLRSVQSNRFIFFLQPLLILNVRENPYE